jgi:UDP-N-acetylmuramate dehydrogenase
LNQELIKALETLVGKEQLYRDEPMSRHTTFRVGGAADVLVCPGRDKFREVLLLCKGHAVPVTVIGNGSNLLVGDGGIRGVVIETLEREDDCSIVGQTVTAGAGMLLTRIAKKAAARGLCGMEFAAGIPGTIGGAVVMNAGAYGGEMKDILQSVTAVTAQGELISLTCEELMLGYRSSVIPSAGYTVTEVELQLKQDDPKAILGRMEELNRKRLEKQPLEFPSAGSTFKRPEGNFAGKLIMEAGLRGYRVGGAQVSEKHCGFVINRGDATAADIRRLMDDVISRVYEQTGITLEPEVKMIGEFV